MSPLWMDNLPAPIVQMHDLHRFSHIDLRNTRITVRASARASLASA